MAKFYYLKNCHARSGSEMGLCTPQVFNQIVDSARVREVCAELAELLKSLEDGRVSKEEYDKRKGVLKIQLPAFCFHASFPSGRRTTEGAVASGLSILDIDKLTVEPRAYYEERIRGREERHGILLAHVTPSLRGLRLVFGIPAGMSLCDAQQWLVERLGIEREYFDTKTKDLARASFAVPREYILHLDERVFGEKSGVSGMGDMGGMSDMGDGQRQAVDSSLQIDNLSSLQNPSSSQTSSLLTFRGVPYSVIIDEWLRRRGGEPQVGERNDTLLRLASQLRSITDGNEELVAAVVPHFGLSDAEVRSTVRSACKGDAYPLSRELREAMESVGCYGEESADEIPPMPDYDTLPGLIRLLLSNTPEVYRPAVAHAVFPALGAHLCDVTFPYIDNVEHEATLMNVLAAETGAGKECITAPIDRIMRDIRRNDEVNRRREREWQETNSMKGANKNKAKRPSGICIQEIDANITIPALMMRLHEASPHRLYIKLNEIEQFDTMSGGSRLREHFTIMKYNFDPGNKYGQTRAGASSVTERETIRLNFNASTTVGRCRKFFREVLNDGPISRINFCTIPQREIGADMPEYGIYTAEFDEALRPYIEHLTCARGCIVCTEAVELAKRLVKECRERAVMTQSRVYENLSFRANVIAYLKACVLYVANGCQWEEGMDEFIRWSLHYDLACKMMFFGEAIALQNESERIGKSRRGPKNLLTMLPETFTLDDAVKVRRLQGMDAKGAKQMIRTWIDRRLVERQTQGEAEGQTDNITVYTKTARYRNAC